MPFEGLEQAFLIFRRSLITWSPKPTYGDYNTSLVTVGVDMLEIGARQLNNWRLHELLDVLPFCQPGVPFNTPILPLAAKSSLPTTWSVQHVFCNHSFSLPHCFAASWMIFRLIIVLSNVFFRIVFNMDVDVVTFNAT